MPLAAMTGNMHAAAVWDITADEFPAAAPLRERMRYWLRYAILAPSTHNTQPWRFRLRDDGLDVRADAARALAIIDARRRQQLMSAGAALYNLIIAMSRFGHVPRVSVLPDPADPDLVARVRLGGMARPSALTYALFDAIPRRRTNRQAFTSRPVSFTIIDELARLAALEGVALTRLHPRAKAPLAEVITVADRAQFADPAFRHELAEWLVPWGSPRRDGIPFAKKEYGSKLPVGPLMVRTFDVGGKVAACERALATGSPALLVLSTPGDTPHDWVACGRGLQAVLLRATGHGLSTSFLNQPLELEPLRARVAELAGKSGSPQLVLRMGYGPPVDEPTPRRELDEMIDD
jgi:nitroreductase